MPVINGEELLGASGGTGLGRLFDDSGVGSGVGCANEAIFGPDFLVFFSGFFGVAGGGGAVKRDSADDPLDVRARDSDVTRAWEAETVAGFTRTIACSFESWEL